MQNEATIWDAIFAREGIVFSHPHEDVLHLADMLLQHGAVRVLDVGCGSGGHVLSLCQRGLTVYGIDSAPTGIALTQQRLQEAGCQRISAKAIFLKACLLPTLVSMPYSLSR